MRVRRSLKPPVGRERWAPASVEIQLAGEGGRSERRLAQKEARAVERKGEVLLGVLGAARHREHTVPTEAENVNGQAVATVLAMAQTLFDRLWESHVVRDEPGQ